MGLAAFIGVAYAIGSMLLGGMLVFARYSGGYSVLVFWGNALGIQPWNYPGVLIEAPWGFVELPFFATVSMLLVSAGVGLGMAVAIVLGVQLLRDRRTSAGRPAAAGTVAGLTPAMIALVTLGACCSTTAAATAGVGLVAQASGSSPSNLLLNNWFLGTFQVAVVYVALIAQELLLRVYGSLFASNDPAIASTESTRPSWNRHSLGPLALRFALLAAGVTWALAVLAAWTTSSPATASGGLWFNWVVEHWILSGVAILAGLAPDVLRGWLRSVASTIPGYALRALIFVGAWTLGAWVPPPLSGAGVEGFGNEVLGLLGQSAAVGAVSPGVDGGVVLVLRWAVQYLLLAGFGAAVALAPKRVPDWLSERDRRPVADRPTEPTATATAGNLPDVR